MRAKIRQLKKEEKVLISFLFELQTNGWYAGPEGSTEGTVGCGIPPSVPVVCSDVFRPRSLPLWLALPTHLSLVKWTL